MFLRIAPGVGEHFEGQRLQAVGGEDRGGLVEGPVGGRLATAQVVVVHCRQVVVDQRVGMDQLHRAGRGVGALRRTAEGLAGGVGEQRANPLATVHHAVAHGLVEALQFFAGSDEQGVRAASTRAWQRAW